MNSIQNSVYFEVTQKVAINDSDAEWDSMEMYLMGGELWAQIPTTDLVSTSAMYVVGSIWLQQSLPCPMGRDHADVARRALHNNWNLNQGTTAHDKCKRSQPRYKN